MTAPTRPAQTSRKAAVPSVADNVAVEAAPNLAQPRPALMDRLHFASAGAADVQKTLGNRIAQRVAQEKQAAGETPADGSAPKRDADARGKDRALEPHADEPTAPHIAPFAPTTQPEVVAASAKGAVAPAPAAPAAMGVPIVQPPAPGPARTVNDLQSQVVRAASAVPKPTGGYTAAQQAIRAQGFRLASAHGAPSAAKKGGGGGGRAHEEHPDRPHEPDPVPKQTKALNDAAKKKLDEIKKFPAFIETPQHHLPKLGTRPLADADLQRLTAATTDERKKLLAEEDKRRLEDRKAGREKEAVNEKDAKKKAEMLAAKPGEGEPKTFAEMKEMLEAKPKPEDEKEKAKKKAKDKDVDDSVPKYPEPEPPGPIVFGEAKKDQMGKVLAGLLAEPDATAGQILHLIRPTVQSKVVLGQTLEEVFPDIGAAQKPKIVTALTEQVKSLQQGAGIADAELQKLIDARKAELAKMRADARAGLSTEQVAAARETREKAKEEAAAAAAKKEAADAKHGVIKKAAPKIKLSMNVDARRARLLGYVAKDVADMAVKLKQKGEIRDMTVAKMANDQIDAYKFAAQQDQYQINSTAKNPRSKETGAALEATRDWLAKRTKAVQDFKTAQKALDNANVAKLQTEVRTAGDAKSEAIRAWADKTSGKKRSEEQKAADRAVDASERKKAEDAAVEQLSKSRVAMGVSNDFGIIDKIAEEVKQGHDKETIAASLHLNAVQRAILDAYMNPPVPGDDRALSGVMAGVRARVQMELTPTIAPEIEKEILGQHSEDEVGLDRIGAVQTPGFVAQERAQKAHAALDKMDTDEDAVYEALDSLTKIQAQAIRLAYKRLYKTTIESDMKGGVIYGMSGSELKRAQKLLEADQAAADAIGYRVALKGNEGAWYHTGLGSGDSEALDKINHGKSKEERQAAEDAYNKENDPELKSQMEAAKNDEERASIMKRYRDSGKSQLLKDAHASLSTERQAERFTASVSGDDETADALELRDLLPTPAAIREVRTASEYSSQGDMSEMVVADRKKVEALYDRIRAEAKARGDREHWTSAEIEAEIARRTDKIEQIFNTKFAKDYEGKEGESPLRTAFGIGFRHNEDEQKLANALADNDTERVDAAKIHIEHRGIYADDDVENAVLESQYKRALEEQRRDEMPIRKLGMSRELKEKEKEVRAKARADAIAKGASPQDADKAADSAWTGAKQWEERERLQRKIDRTLESAAAEQAKGNMNALRDAYKKDYNDDLDAVVKSDTSGYSGDKAEKLLAQNGQLTLGQTMFYAVRGVGTDEAALDTLKGHTKAEIDEARKDFKKLAEADNETGFGTFNRLWGRWDNTDMDQEILDDVSGRTGFDVSQMLKGEPETIEEKKERLKEAVDWEKQAGPLGNWLASDQEEALQYDLDRLDATIKKLNDPKLTAEQREIYLGFFDQDVASVNAGIKAHREMLDTWTDRITTVVGIVVGLAVTILTFGAAGPVMAAVLGSVLATAATMALKAEILGAAYGWEDIGTDIVVGIVDALTAALTAGMGGKLLGTAEKAGAPAASKLAFGKMVQRSLGAGGKLAILNPAESALAKAIPTSTMLKEMVERGGISKFLAMGFAEGAEVLVQATPSALASTLLDENTYKEGNILGNIASGTMKQAGMSLGMAMGMKVGMHAAHPVREFGGRIFEAFGKPSAPELHDFKLAQREFPGITHEEFSKMRAAAEIEMRERERAGTENSTHADEPQKESAREEASESASGERSSEQKPMPDKPVPAADVGESRPSQAGIPEPKDPSTIKGPDFTTPRELTEAHVKELVPKSLQDKLTVKIDPDLPPGTVKVERVMRLGIVTDVKLVVGPHVRPIDVIMHGKTVRQMQRYLGVTGRIVSAIERMRSLIVRDGLPPFGTKAWEAYHELQKLPKIIDQRLEMLRTGALDPHAEAEIHADIEHLSRQVDEHRALLAIMDKSPGEGFIAQKGREPNLEPHDSRQVKRENRGDPSLERHPAEHSALKEKYPKAEFVMVDRPWIEEKADGVRRTYRVLEVRDPKTGEVLVRREEIRSLDASGREVDHWVQRGSEANVTGEVGETARNLQYEAEHPAGSAREKPVPQDLIQRGGGQGFDGVIIAFDKGGATIILIEVKNYPDRYVPLSDITAIKENLNNNLKHLEGLLKNAEAREKMGLSKEEAKQALEAIKKNKLEFEMHVGDTTKLGELGDTRASVLEELKKKIARERGMKAGEVKLSKKSISPEFMRAAEALVQARERVERLKGTGPALMEELHQLSKGGGTTVTEQGVRRAEAALTAQQKIPGLADRPLQATKTPNTFIDAKKNPFTVFAPERGTKTANLATEVVKGMRTATSGGKMPRMIIDVTELSLDAQRALRRDLQTLANKAPKLNLQNVVIVDNSRGLTARFTSLPK
ncbi:MAG TPA: hypothetical protein VGQ56_16395 [Gemmatimonadaceae bacterium]|nr:hypothetical protein [Gemmatimonadaceae bacterium]